MSVKHQYKTGDIVRVKHFDEIIPTENSKYQTQASKENGEYFGISRDAINRTAAESDYYIISARGEIFSPPPAYVLKFPDGSLKELFFVEEMLEYIGQGDIEAETDIAPINETDFQNYLFG